MYCAAIICTVYFVMKRGGIGPDSSHIRPPPGPTRTAPDPRPGRSACGRSAGAPELSYLYCVSCMLLVC